MWSGRETDHSPQFSTEIKNGWSYTSAPHHKPSCRAQGQLCLLLLLHLLPDVDCRKLFSNLEILPLPSQYILPLLLFTVRNKNHFQVNSEIYRIDTRQHANFHQPSVNITRYQKGAYCLGVKVYKYASLLHKNRVWWPQEIQNGSTKFLI